MFIRTKIYIYMYLCVCVYMYGLYKTVLKSSFYSKFTTHYVRYRRVSTFIVAVNIFCGNINVL